MSTKSIGILFSILFIVKISSIYYTNFDLFGDEAQYWLWSKKLDFGYFSKPPFLSWFIWLYISIFGESFVSLKMMPSLVYFLVAVSLYNLCRNIGLEKLSSLSCVFLFLFIPAVSFSSFFVTTDLFLIFFWTLSLSFLIKIKKSPSTINFILLGIFIGLAFLSKYAAIYFLISCFIYILLDKDFRKAILSNYIGFFLGIICVFIIVLPNIIWNLNNGWVTLQHTSDNANLDDVNISLSRGFAFLLAQILMVGPILFLGNIVNFKKIEFSSNKKILLIFSLPIFLIVFIEAIAVRANANWAAPAIVSFFLYLYLNIYSLKSIYLKINIVFNFVFCLIFFTLIGFSYPAKIFDRIIGINDYANNVMNEINKSGIKDFVISDRLIFASFAYELKGYNFNFHMPHREFERITNHFKITSPLDKEMENSFVLIGHKSDIDYLNNDFTCENRKLEKQYEKDKRITQSFKICFN
tara:strand:- start:6429 stop:7829 length:1401 start_codon:yes stop_codon:yes gene_type:complete